MNPPPAPSPGTGEGADPELDLEVRQAYLAHARAVYRSAYRAALGDHEAAQDATQEAFLEAVRDWPRLRQAPPGVLRSWLCLRARWRVIDSWRATGAEHSVEAVPEQPDPHHEEDTVLDSIAAESFWKEITTAVPLRAARAAYLRWNMEWTMVEIARYLGVDRATVYRDLTAAQPGGSTSLRPGNEGREA